MILATAGLMTSCQAKDVSGGNQGAAAALAMRVEGEGDRPLAPSLIEFVHVEGPAGGASTKTYIQVSRGEPWTRTFGNVTFGIDDPFITGITGDPSLPPRITVRSSLVRATSPADVIEKLRQFGSDLSTPGLGPTARALVFLVPGRTDFDSAVSAIRTAAVPGLAPLALLAPQCAYARLRTDGSQRQAAVLVVHVPDLKLSLDDPSDAQCVERFFAQNLGLSETVIRDLIFPPGASPQGGCDVARILRPSQMSEAGPLATAGCPIAPVRRAATLLAYAEMRGVGLTPAQASRLIELTKHECERQKGIGEIWDGSCRSVARGVN